MTQRSSQALAVPTLSRNVIDAWPVAQAGLPQRVVNACRRQAIETLGELRRMPAETLMKMRSFGSRSLKEVEDFFKFCDQLERGRVRFASASALLEQFLSPTAMAILTARYALRDKSCAVTPGATLDAIGQDFGLTRERVRQQIVAIHEELRTHLAQACLAPVIKLYADFLQTRDGVAGAGDFETVPFRRWLDGINPCRLLQLLVELQDAIILRGTLYSLYPAETIEEIEKTAVRYLHRNPKPRRLSDVIAEFEEQDWFRPPRGFSPRLVVSVMEHSDHIGATQDDHYFLFPEGAVYLLATLLSEFPSSARHRQLINRFNEEVKPNSQRGTDYLTDLLTRASIFIRGRDGTYRLRR